MTIKSSVTVRCREFREQLSVYHNFKETFSRLDQGCLVMVLVSCLYSQYFPLRISESGHFSRYSEYVTR